VTWHEEVVMGDGWLNIHRTFTYRRLEELITVEISGGGAHVCDSFIKKHCFLALTTNSPKAPQHTFT